jgi:hypothetical protein
MVGIQRTWDLNVSLDAHTMGLDEVDRLWSASREHDPGENPVFGANGMEVLSTNPSRTLMRVSPLCPTPKGMMNFVVH